MGTAALFVIPVGVNMYFEIVSKLYVQGECIRPKWSSKPLEPGVDADGLSVQSGGL